MGGKTDRDHRQVNHSKEEGRALLEEGKSCLQKGGEASWDRERRLLISLGGV